MLVEEILATQKKCQKRAQKIARRVYRTYDRIWVQRIRITPELEASGRIPEINSKMPNLLLRNGDAPDICETAAAYGFADADTLIAYLANYQSRKQLVQQIYERLLAKALCNATMEEFDLALAMEPKELAGIVRSSKALAAEYVREAYAKYDEVWYGKIKITPELRKHGADTISEINAKLPNLLTNDSRYLALDQAAMIYGFETTQELVDWLLAYKPRGGMKEEYSEKLARQELGLHDEDYWQEAGEIALPF